MANITRDPNSPILPNSDIGLVIQFSRPVHVINHFDPFNPNFQIDSEHVFQVLARYDPDGQNSQLGYICHCPIRGGIVPVDNFVFDADGRIIQAEEIISLTAPGAAFIFDQSTQSTGYNFIIEGLSDVQVRLLGDFVIDETLKAIDAEFLRAEFPTGDRPSGSPVGVQGGLFESWFWVPERPFPFFSLSQPGDRISVNRATEEELTNLPGIGKTLAKRIIDQRSKSPFKKLEDLLKVSGMPKTLYNKIRNRVTVD